MRWLILLMTSVLLGACAASIEPQATPIGSPPPREPTAADRVDSTAPASPTSEPASKPTSVPAFRANLPDLGVAPELNNEVWLNTDQPLRLAGLQGKVVLIDMWTFG